MKPLRECVGRRLEWKQPHLFRRDYELRAGDELVATLEFLRNVGWAARAGTAEGAWILNRKGWFRRQVEVRREGSDVVLATLSRRWRGGTLEFAGGKTFTWKTLRFWPPETGFLDREDHVLIRIRSRWNPFRAGARVTVERRADALEELPLLVLTGWYTALAVRNARHRGAG